LFRLIPGLILLICIVATSSFAAEQPANTIQNAFSLRFENDCMATSHRDENYTNGISMALTQKSNGLLGGIWNLFGSVEGTRFSTYELAQLMFTPTNLRLSNPDPTDRPYAGIIYLGLGTHLAKENSLHSLKLMLGLVGPDAYASDVQGFAHKIFNSTHAQGWHYQLKNEPIFNLIYEYRYRYALTPRDSAFGVEVIPMAGAFLGNYLVQGETDVQLRFGYHLPNDFGTTVLRGSGYLPPPQDDPEYRKWGVYAFAGAGANLVARNITLDGNTVADSRSIGKNLFLPAGELGATIWSQWAQATFSYVLWGKEFSSQPKREDYGSVLVSFFF